MDWENANFTPSIERDPALTEWIRSNSTVISYPAKTVFLTPGTILNGVYYIARRNALFSAGTHRPLFQDGYGNDRLSDRNSLL